MLSDIKTAFGKDISQSSSVQELNNLKVKYLGRDGLLTNAFKSIKDINSPEEKKAFGAQLNDLKTFIENKIDLTIEGAKIQEINSKLEKEFVDISLPTRKTYTGGMHPLTLVSNEIIDILAGKFGFNIEFEREIEDEFHNFDALNVSENHPARQMHDTFYLDCVNDKLKPLLLRTHTSSVQIRKMIAQKPPFRFLSLGKVYRCDSDRTHSPMFHQIEGLYIDKNVNMGHLKYVLDVFLKSFFEDDKIIVRLRPSFFPFTEPSAEVDIGYRQPNGEVKYLEVMGCGVVHPNVLKNCNVNPDEWRGFAFGMGLERLAMLKYKIDDLRCFFEGDYRWLSSLNSL